MLFSLSRLVSLLVIFALTCAPVSFADNPRIIGGTEATEEYPFMVALIPRGSDPARDSIACGGALIHPKYILTAAHCVSVTFVDSDTKVIDPNIIQVLVGRARLSDAAGEIVNVSRIVVHPNHDVSFTFLNYDFALLELEKEVTQNPISMVEESELALFEPDAPARILGWGTMDPELVVLPDMLQQADIRIGANEVCSQTLGLAYQSESMLCAGLLASSSVSEDGVDACSGDSGGPLIVPSRNEFKLAGITSFGFGCASDKFLGVYSRVTASTEWVKRLLTAHEEVAAPLENVKRLLHEAFSDSLKSPGPSADPSTVSTYEAIRSAREQIRLQVTQLKSTAVGDSFSDIYTQFHPGALVTLERYLRRLSRSKLKPQKRRKFLRKADRLLTHLLS